MHIDSEATLSNRPYTDPQKIALAASFLEKEALQWYILYFVQHRNHPDIAPILTDFERWAKALQHRFQDVRTRQTRRDAWDALVQSGSAANFAQRIESDAMYLEPRPTEDDMLLLFKRGLRADIRARIETLPDDYVPNRYHAYAIFADKQERELQANRWQNSNRKSFESNPKANKSSRFPLNRNQGHSMNPPHHQPWKKDVDGDTVMTLNALRPDRSKEEQDKWFSKCRERNACFKCGKEGHKANACKNLGLGAASSPSVKKWGKGRSH
jgi:Zinc knuckle